MRALRLRVAVAVAVVALVVVAGRGTAVADSPAASRIVFAADRTPDAYGEIYRVTSTGRRLDLSRSPAPDIAPAVSPDGRWVAFLSGRGGEWAVYVVGTDGRGLRRISRPLFPLVPNEGAQAQIAWAPNSLDLAFEVGGTKTVLYLGRRTATARATARDVAGGGPTLAWSPDGRLLAYSTSGGLVRVVSPAGKLLWSAAGSVGEGAWSAGDRLAVSVDSDTIRVYDRDGRAIAGFAGRSPAWSPTAELLASVSAYAVQVRRAGRGAPVLRRPLRNAGSLQWVGSTRLRAFGQNGWVGFDVAHGRPWNLIGPATAFNSVVSVSGQVLAEQQHGKNGSTLVLTGVGSAGARTVARGPWCPDEGDFARLAFLPGDRGVLYQTSCISPPADIYSVEPDGSGLRGITSTPADEMEPSLSPDGQSIVFVQQLSAGKCEGCPRTLWRVPANGGALKQLTSHTFQDDAPFDESPTWSPDGSEIAFQNSGANAPLRLLTMPATGGAAQDLGVKGAAIPVWGPQQIAVADWSVPKLVIRTVDPATRAVRIVAGGGRTDAQALAWSAGGRLAYLYDGANGHALVAIAGSNAKPLDLSIRLPPHAAVAGLAWSPDGARFAFAATDADGVGEIYTIAVDGSDLRQVTKDIGALCTIGYQGTVSWR